jgi:hypothetical protein
VQSEAIAMNITLTPTAHRFLTSKGAQALTVASLIFSSCCSGPLPPEVKVGAPRDSEGFDPYQTQGVTLIFDSLLDPRPEIIIDVKDYGSYRELFVVGWE